MKHAGAVAAALLLVVPSIAGLAQPSVEHDVEAGTTPFPMRPSILITGEEDFTLENGVRSGNGTAENPYVISNWTIIKTRGFGIRVEDTSAHFEIRNVTIPFAEGLVTGEPECLRRGSTPFCGAAQGIELLDVENAAVENVHIGGAFIGIRVGDSAHVTVDGVNLTPSRADAPGDGFARGIQVDDSQGVRISNATVQGASADLGLHRSSRLLVDHVSMPGDGFFRTQFVDLTSTVIRHSEFGGEISMRGRHENLSFQENDIVTPPGEYRGGGVMLEGPRSDILVDSVLCGNTFAHKQGDWGLKLERGKDVRVLNNRFHNNTVAMELRYMEGYTVAGNLVRDNWQGVDLHLDRTMAVEDGQFHDNSLVNNTANHTMRRGANWSHNWWGDASGPNITGQDGPGTGDPLEIQDTEAEPGIVEPWLTEPPEMDFDCIPGDERGAQREVRIPTRVTAQARAHASWGPVEAGAEAIVHGGGASR